MRTVTRAAAIAILLAFASTASARQLPRLKVSENKRFLVTAAGQPFFWLGDTAWELFHRLTREDAERYPRNRAERRFTIVQAVVLAELDGLNDPNLYGHTPLRNNDPTQPNEDYFAHVDWVVKRANAMGLYVGMLPTWGDKWNRNGAWGPVHFTPANARVYGEWLGKRYRERASSASLDCRRRSSNRKRHAPGRHAGDGGRPARRRWRRASHHLPSAGRRWVLDLVP